MAKVKNKVVEILMDRDGMTESEAMKLIQDTREDMEICIADGDYEGAEDVMYMNLGLEMDYIFDVLM